MSQYDETTVGSVANFPVIDVTHKPKRKQGDMIRLKQRLEGRVDEDTPEETNANAPLKVITLERAISYYKRMSADETNGKLYEATAKWLEELLVTRSSKTEAARKAVFEGENIADVDTKEE